MFIGFFAVLFCGDLKVGVLVPDAHSAAVTAAVRSHRRRTTEAAGWRQTTELSACYTRSHDSVTRRR